MEAFLDSLESNQFLNFKEGEYLFKKNENVKGIYCLLSGKVKVVNEKTDKLESVLYYANSPDIFCLYSILNEEKYETSAIAMGDVKVCYIPKKDFMKIMLENNKFTLSLMRIICSKINRIENQINYNIHLN